MGQSTDKQVHPHNRGASTTLPQPVKRGGDGPERQAADAQPVLKQAQSPGTGGQLEMELIFQSLQSKLFGGSIKMMIGHYFLVRSLGRGGMGLVFEAIDTRLNRRVALKLWRPDVLGSAEGQARLMREARAMAQVSHPNVAAIYDVGESGNRVYITMELIDGMTMRDWLEHATPSWGEIVDVFIQAGAGLDAAHEAGLVHRDFKPENVLIGEDGRTRVVDFGLAFPPVPSPLCPTAVPYDTRITPDNAIIGTIGYMSPEQLCAQPLDGRSDQFSYCVTLFEALFGRRPFPGDNRHEIAESFARNRLQLLPLPPPMKAPAWLVSVVCKGLSTTPDHRYRSMAELVELLSAGRSATSPFKVQLGSSVLYERMLSHLECEFEEIVLASTSVALLRARKYSDGQPLLVAVPRDGHDERIREAFIAYFKRLREHSPVWLRPAALVDEGALIGLVFDGFACIPLGGFIHRWVDRDLGVALQIAIHLSQTIGSLAAAGLSMEEAAIENLVVRLPDYSIVPVAPSHFDVAMDDHANLLGRRQARYRIVGQMLLAMLTVEPGDLTPSGRSEFDERRLPMTVKAIIDRLLDGAEHYRSARGLQLDLQRCLLQWEDGREIHPFPLGIRDVGERFRVSRVIQGRGRELEHCGEIFRKVSTGGTAMILASGPSGIGKTAFIDALCATLGSSRRIQGKFDQYGNNEPYATIVQALRTLVCQLLDEKPLARSQWQRRILKAVTPNAELLFSVIPEIRTLIGDQPSVALLPPAESAIRFRETLGKLLGACATAEKPLVIVLDDMQWCDQASVSFISALLGDHDINHILWIGAFRDGELAAEHPLRTLLASPDGAALRHRIHLGPFSRAHLRAFLIDTLACPEAQVETLTTFFMDKTDGNPLFVCTLLASLHDQGLFAYDPRLEQWSWDDIAIRSAELPRDIQELIASKIASLEPAARVLLSTASCIGQDVETEILLEVIGRRGHPREGLTQAIQDCVSRGLLSSTLVPAPRSQPGNGIDILNFTHDRVQQTAYQLLDADDRAAINLEIGRTLLERCSPEALDERLFRIVGHLNSGPPPAEGALRERLIELNLLAARRALGANAFADSVKLLQLALALLPETLWDTHYAQAVDLYVSYLHAESLLGNHEEEDRLFALLCSNVRTRTHVSQIYELKVELESARGAHKAAIEHGLEGMRALGESLPRSAGRMAALVELAHTSLVFRGHTSDTLDQLPPSDQEDAAISRLLVALSVPAYLADSNLMAIVMMRIVRRSLRFGMTDVSSHGFAGLGLIFSGLFGRYQRAHRFGMIARHLNERFRNPWLQPKIDLINGIFILPWTQPFESCEQLLQRGAQVATDNADLSYSSYNLTSMVCVMYYRGAELGDVLTSASSFLKHTRRARDYDMETVVTTVMRACMCLRGETTSPTDFSGGGFNERAFEATINKRVTPVGVFFYKAIRCSVLYLNGRADLACEVGQQASTFEGNALSNPSLAEFLFYYAMALLSEWPRLGAGQRALAKRTVKRALMKLNHWAELCPANYEARHLLVRAELGRVQRRRDVLDQLNAAIESAVKYQRLQYHALAAELAANYCAAANQPTVAQAYLKQAHRTYLRWGARVKTEGLAARLLAGEHHE